MFNNKFGKKLTLVALQMVTIGFDTKYYRANYKLLQTWES
jgi:hypothetical protein